GAAHVLGDAPVLAFLDADEPLGPPQHVEAALEVGTLPLQSVDRRLVADELLEPGALFVGQFVCLRERAKLITQCDSLLADLPEALEDLFTTHQSSSP